MKYQLIKKIFGIDASEELRSMKIDEVDSLIERIVNAQNDLLSCAEADGRDLTDDEADTYDEADKLVDKAMVEKRRRIEGKSQRSIPIAYCRDDGVEPIRQYGIVHPTYGELFHNQRNYQPPKVDRELFYRQVMANSVPVDSRSMSVGVGAEGGFTVPTAVEAGIFQATMEESIIFPRVKLYNMPAHSQHIPGWKSSDRSREDGVPRFFGGVAAQRLSEGSTASLKTPKLRDMTLTAKKVGLYIAASREVLEDSNSIASVLEPQMVSALAATYDDDVLVGDGVGKPQGVLNSPATISITRNTASQVNYVDLVAMLGRIHPQFTRRAVWVIAPNVLEQLLLLQDGASHYIFPPSIMGAAQDVPQSMLGRPLFISESLPELGERGDVLLCDFSLYAFGLRAGVILQKSEHVRYMEDETVFRVLARYDGQALLEEPITPINGSTETLSFAAVLE